MGVDLVLIPVECEHPAFGHTLLRLDPDHDLWGAFEGVDDREAPDDFTTYLARIPDGIMKGESCYGVVITDPYGKRLRAVRVGNLLDAWPKRRGSVHNGRNLAVRAYLELLDRKSWVVLYWC